MQLVTDALEPEQQAAAELILPIKYALDGIEGFLEYVSIEQRFPATLGKLPASGIGIDVGDHAAVEESLALPILPAIVDAIQTDDGSLKVQTNRTGHSHHVWQGRSQERRFVVKFPGSRDKRRHDIAIPVAEGDYLIAALAFLCPLKPMLSPPFFAAVVVPSPWMMVTSKTDLLKVSAPRL